MAATMGWGPGSVGEGPNGGALGAVARRHPLPVHYALVFAISWGAVVAVLGLDGLPPTLEQWQGVTGV